jgi:hypothetical protein
MKKLYTLVGAVLISGLAMGQTFYGPVKADQSVINVGNKSIQHKTVKGEVEGAAKGGVIWSEDCSSGSAGNLPTGWTGVINGGVVPWEWTDVGHTGPYASAALTSTTAANGWFIIDSDLHGTSGNPEDVTLTSPVIDLTGELTATLKFEQYFREWQVDITTVQVSGDNGSTWTDYLINEGVGQAGTANPDIVSINITTVAANQPQVLIRFWWQGDWDYGWQIDDIEIVSTANYDVAIGGPTFNDNVMGIFGFPVKYPEYPTDQVGTLDFLSSASNVGANTANNVALNVDVVDQGGAGSSVWNQTGTPIPSIGLNLSDTVWSMGYALPSTIMEYQADYSVTYDDLASDATPADNLGMDVVEVSDFRYRRDNDNYTGAGLWNGDDGGTPPSTNPFVMGPTYDIKNNAMCTGLGAVFTASTNPGAIAYAQLYQIDAATGDFNLIADGSGTLTGELTIGAGDIPTGTGPDQIEVFFEFTTPVAVTAGETYIAAIGHYGGPDAIVLGQGGTAAQQTVFLLDGTDNTWYYMTSVPMVRMWLNDTPTIGIEEDAANNITMSQNIPNPTNGTTLINYSLEEAANVSFEVVDITGKVVYTVNKGELAEGSYTLELNASELAAGVYYYSMIANTQKLTKKMVITE